MFSSLITISRTDAGSASDIIVGQQVFADGKNNLDGTLQAQNI